MRPHRATLLGVAGLLASLAVGIALLAQTGGASGSSFSRLASGWLVARLYLEENYVETEILDAPLGLGRGAGVLVLVFPWQHGVLDDPVPAIEDHLLRRGTVLLGYSGDHFATVEPSVLRGLGAPFHSIRNDPPLHPLRWREHARTVWSLRAPGEQLGARPPRVRAVDQAPRPPSGSRVLLENGKGTPLAFEYARGRGRVIVVPAEILSNGRIAEVGNGDFLATLAASLPERWAFDEYHHGAVSPTAAGGTRGTERFLDHYLIQLVLLYVLAVLALVQRFGPAWREPAVVGGSAAGFLVGLGAVHERLRHHTEAVAPLIDRARELAAAGRHPRDPRHPLSVPADLEARARAGPAGFLELARHIGRMQERRR